MATINLPVINPEIDQIEKGSRLDQLYTAFVDMANRANRVEAPDFTLDPPMKVDEDGNQLYDPNDPVVPLVDTELIEKTLSEYAEIQTKNYSYDLASAINSAVGNGDSGEGDGSIGTGYLPLAGGSMSGRLAANHGVELGDLGKAYIIITHDINNNPIGYFDLPISISENVAIDGTLSLNDIGIWFNKHQTIYVEGETLNIDYSHVLIKEALEIEGLLTIGDIIIDGDSGITFKDFQFYHSGNSNLPDVNWCAKDMHVYGDLNVEGPASLSGRLSALYGFDLGENGDRYLYSDFDSEKARIYLATDLTILGYQNGIKFDSHYIIRTKSTSSNVISFCAPGKTLNLGDSEDQGLSTISIALQSNFNTADNAVTLITPSGKGFFRGLSAIAVDSGSDVISTLVQGSVIATYVETSENKGVVFRNRVTLYNPISGPSIFSDNGIDLVIESPYLYFDNEIQVTDKYLSKIRYINTTSPFADLQSSEPSLELTTTGQFFSFGKPVESDFFAIKLGTHKTRLIDGVLFLDNSNVDGSALFLEADGNAIFHSGNATFNLSLSSNVFTSGLSGWGWAILKNALNGSYHATFDELTVRKTLRVYSSEVQKQNVTNGSWWVTDSCSGDFVEEIE